MKKVLVIFGGNSFEHYVSCKSAKSIIENIDKKLFECTLVGIDFDNKWYQFKDDLDHLEKGTWKQGNTLEIEHITNYLKRFDVIFPIIHGANGEDGKLQGLLELLQLRFVGGKTLGSAIGMDKEMSKIVFEHLGIPQVPYLVVEEESSIPEIISRIDFPVIVKPANGGSSVGISKANDKKQLKKAIKEAKKYDKKIIIEKYIKARELECAVLEFDNKLLCSYPGEIKSANELYDYDAKYKNEKSYTIIPTDLSETVTKTIQNYASRIFKGLNINGYSRIDFFYDEVSETVYINEINTIPGFTSISMYPKLMENEGISYQELLTILISNA